MLLSGLEVAGLVRCVDGLSDNAVVRLSQVDSLGGEYAGGFLRVQVLDGDYVADDLVGPTGSVVGSFSPVAP